MRSLLMMMRAYPLFYAAMAKMNRRCDVKHLLPRLNISFPLMTAFRTIFAMLRLILKYRFFL